tara:strand:+ start:414 stop:689 length:276 start_codon:yes stop_codon:yes gene_type:complete
LVSIYNPLSREIQEILDGDDGSYSKEELVDMIESKIFRALGYFVDEILIPLDDMEAGKLQAGIFKSKSEQKYITNSVLDYVKQQGIRIEDY